MPVSGRFYFKLTSNGNLLGEFSNNLSRSCSAESAERVENVEDPAEAPGSRFIGLYRSVWLEDGGEHQRATLTIGLKPNCTGIFSMTWTAPGDTNLFEGEAMLCDEILIGNYWSV